MLGLSAVIITRSVRLGASWWRGSGGFTTAIIVFVTSSSWRRGASTPGERRPSTSRGRGARVTPGFVVSAASAGTVHAVATMVTSIVLICSTAASGRRIVLATTTITCTATGRRVVIYSRNTTGRWRSLASTATAVVRVTTTTRNARRPFAVATMRG